jgi:hypothetical protein
MPNEVTGVWKWIRLALIGIVGCSASTARAGKPVIHIENRTVDIGNVMQGDTATAVFTIENRGDGDLMIEQLTAGCGCTVPKDLSAEQRRVEPGETLDIEAVFDSKGRSGAQRKDVTIISNDPVEPRLQVFLTAKVVTLFELIVDGRDSQGLRFGNVRPGQGLGKSVDVLPTLPGGALEIESVEIGHPAFSQVSSPIAVDDRKGYRLELSVDRGAMIGQVTTSMAVRGRVGSDKSTASLTLSGEIVGELGFRPNDVKQWQPSIPGTRLRPVTVMSFAGEPFEILGADAGPVLDATFEANADRSEYTVTMTIRDDAPGGPFGANLRIRTNNVEQPLIVVPVFANVRPLVGVYPEMALLTKGASSRVFRLEAFTGDPLAMGKVTCENAYVKGRVMEPQYAEATQSVKYVEVSAVAGAPSGTHEGVVRVEVDVRGRRVVELPFALQVE